MTDYSDLHQLKSIRAKLNAETAKIQWRELQLAFAQGHLVVISHELDLIDIGAAFYLDDAVRIEQMLQQDKIRKPDVNWIKSHCKDETLFWAVVVKPFVIVQPIL